MSKVESIKVETNESREHRISGLCCEIVGHKDRPVSVIEEAVLTLNRFDDGQVEVDKRLMGHHYTKKGKIDKRKGKSNYLRFQGATAWIDEAKLCLSLANIIGDREMAAILEEDLQRAINREQDDRLDLLKEVFDDKGECCDEA